MRRIVLLAAAASLFMSVLSPAAAGALPPTPSMTATACLADASTMRVEVSWSHLAVTGGEISVDTIPFSIDLHAIWNQKGKHGTHTEEFPIAGRVIDQVIVNLYNDKIAGWFEQRQIGGDDDVAELFPTC